MIVVAVGKTFLNNNAGYRSVVSQDETTYVLK